MTHSSEIAAFGDRSLELIDGRFVAEHGVNIDISNLSDTRRIILDRTGNMTLPPDVLGEIGGPGVFDVTNVTKDELSMIRVIAEGNEPESRLIAPLEICPACGYNYESVEADTCSRCGALRTHRN